MSAQTEPKNYPISPTPKLQNELWRFERIGWVFLTLFIVLSFLGLFGSGFLSGKTISAGNSRVEYSPWTRVTESNRITIYNPHTTIAKLNFDLEDLKKVSVTSLDPGSNPHLVVFEIVPRKVGRVNFTVFSDGHEIPIEQFAFP